MSVQCPRLTRCNLFGWKEPGSELDRPCVPMYDKMDFDSEEKTIDDDEESFGDQIEICALYEYEEVVTYDLYQRIRSISNMHCLLVGLLINYYLYLLFSHLPSTLQPSTKLAAGILRP